MSKFITKKGIQNVEHKILETAATLARLVSCKTDAYETGGNGWHENSAFEDLVERERILQNELEGLKNVIDTYTVVEPHVSDSVGIGAIVTVQDEEGKEYIYTITDSFCVDVEKLHISYDSPLGALLMNKRIGDVVFINKNNTQKRSIVDLVYNS